MISLRIAALAACSSFSWTPSPRGIFRPGSGVASVLSASISPPHRLTPVVASTRRARMVAVAVLLREDVEDADSVHPREHAHVELVVLLRPASTTWKRFDSLSASSSAKRMAPWSV
jgi:hypothetical protein